MRQKENIQQLELVDGIALLDGKREHVQPHRDVLAAGQLGAQNAARGLVVHHAQPGFVVAAFDEGGLLPVLPVGGRGVIAQRARLFQ